MKTATEKHKVHYLAQEELDALVLEHSISIDDQENQHDPKEHHVHIDIVSELYIPHEEEETQS